MHGLRYYDGVQLIPLDNPYASWHPGASCHSDACPRRIVCLRGAVHRDQGCLAAIRTFLVGSRGFEARDGKLRARYARQGSSHVTRIQAFPASSGTIFSAACSSLRACRGRLPVPGSPSLRASRSRCPSPCANWRHPPFRIRCRRPYARARARGSSVCGFCRPYRWSPCEQRCSGAYQRR